MMTKFLSEIRITIAVPLVTLCICFTSCTTNSSFNTTKTEYLRALSSPNSKTNCSLSIIEFDDQGELWNQDQVDSTVENIRAQEKENPDGIIVLVYIHGWKQNASWEEGSRLTKFNNDLLSIAESTNHSTPVVGVYLSWRGSSTKMKSFEDLTFWNRKAAAERVASLAMTETLLRVMFSAKENPNSKCIVMGYSMGGFILEKALSHVLLLAALQKETTVEAPIDLMVTIGSSSPALLGKQTIEAFKRNNSHLIIEHENGMTEEASGPLMVSITSETDTATGFMYPLVQTLSSVFARYRSYEETDIPTQRFMATHTIGHVPFLRSHKVDVENGKSVIKEIDGAMNDTPFWVMSVPDEVSSGHSDSSTILLDDLLTQLVMLNDVYRTGKTLKIAHVDSD